VWLEVVFPEGIGFLDKSTGFLDKLKVGFSARLEVGFSNGLGWIIGVSRLTRF
jgi:hypothetical protein